VAAPAVLNASNEIAVAAFLEGLIPFGSIADTNRKVLDRHLAEAAGTIVTDLEDVMEADRWARSRAREALGLDEPGSGAAERKAG
jgi:1-deoxy-D-xylulose-5-phosphate reductoisomerase